MGAIPAIDSFGDSRNLLTILTLTAVVIIGARSLLCFHLKKQKEHNFHGTILFGLSLVVLPYLPASNLFFPVGFVVAERVLYLPSMGFILLVVQGIKCLITWSNSRRHRKYFGASIKTALVLLVVLQSVRTIARNRDWYSNLTLYVSSLSVHSENPIVYSNMGVQYKEKREYEKAEKMLSKAIELHPNSSLFNSNMGALMYDQGRLDESQKVQLPLPQCIIIIA